MSTSDTFLTRCIYHRKEGKESYYWWYKNHELIDWHLFSLVGNLGDSSIEQIVVWIPSKIQVIRSRFPSSYVVDSCDHCWLDPFFPSPRQNSGEKRTKRGHRGKLGSGQRCLLCRVIERRSSGRSPGLLLLWKQTVNLVGARWCFSGEEGGPLEGDNWLVIGSIQAFQMRRRSFPIVGDTVFRLSRNSSVSSCSRTCSRVGIFFFFFRDIDNFYFVQLFHPIENLDNSWYISEFFQLIPSWLIVLLAKLKYFDDKKRHFV